MSTDVATLEKPWKEYTFVAFDTETSGQYPIVDEIVEIGMIKWRGGQIIDRYQTLIKPSKPMGEAVIKIHGITNEMVEHSPAINDKINEIYDFLNGSVVIAHHAPFDLGFLTYEFEKFRKPLFSDTAVCTSLLARALIQSPNHRLQTMVKLLNINHEQAHRAESDAEACLQLAFHCMNLVGANATLKQVVKAQKRTLWWQDYSLKTVENNQKWRGFMEALHEGKNVEFVYEAGTHKGKPRQAKPIGVVRNPDGDYFPALCLIDNVVKRFYMNKISDSLIIN